MKDLAFQIVNDLLFAGVIVEDANPIKVQNLVQARLSKDRRFREKIVHLAHSEGHQYAGRRICHGVGRSLHVTLDPTQVTCLHCLNMHYMRDWAIKQAAGEEDNDG